MHIAKWKRTVWKGYVLYDILTRGKTIETVKKISGAKSLERGIDR